MAKANKEIVEEVNAKFTANDPEGFLDLCDEKVVWSMVGEKTRNGKSEIREWKVGMKDMEPPKFTVVEYIAEGDSVACRGDMTMKDEKGFEGKYSFCDFYRFRNGKITELNSYIVKHKTEGEKDRSATA